jgi:hypothetical protein
MLIFDQLLHGLEALHHSVVLFSLALQARSSLFDVVKNLENSTNG